MKSFIRKVFEKEVDEFAHRQFVRFGKGKYEKRALLSLRKTDKIKVSGSFEYANDFVNLVAEFPAKFSGIILAKENIDELGQGKKKGELIAYGVENLGNEIIKKISNKVHYMLVDGSGPGFELKIKKNLPKLGNSGETKIDNKFCQLKADLNYWNKIKEAFFWDLEGKKAVISHDFLIDNLILPEGEKDFEKIRIMAKRVGKIIRKSIVDGKEQVKEEGFEA